MTGKTITAQAVANRRAELTAHLKLQATPLEAIAERAKTAALKRQQAGGKMAVPLALQTALAGGSDAPERVYRDPDTQGAAGTITPPEEKTPERVKRRGRTTPLGTLMRGMIQPGVRAKEDSRFAYAAGNNYMDRQVPPERERGEE